LGDALGAGIEFLDLDAIRRAHGPEGVTGLVPAYGRRGAVTDETIAVCRQLWGHDNPRFEGKYAKFSDVFFEPRPVQQPIPIWVGGESGPAMRRTARLGDAWYPIGTNPRNRLDTLAYSVEKTLSENKEKLSAAELGEVNAALEDAKKALESEDEATLSGAIDRLEKSTHKLAEVMYRETAGAKAGGGTDGGGEQAASSDEVIDAEVVDSDGKSS